jgi:hypothetical protein
MSEVVGDEEGRSCADGRGQNRHILRVGEFARSFTVVRCRTVDLERDGAEDSSKSVRTSASTQTANGSVLSGWATQILQGQLSRSAQTLRFSSEPRHYRQARAERVAHFKNR